jgi:diguanylate cyclase
MLYTEPFDKAAAFCAEALKLMAEKKIPANPVNFAVWYGYVAGLNPDLTKAIDEQLAGGGDWSAEQNERLFREFISTEAESRKFNEASVAVEKQIEQILGMMRDASADNSGSSEKLADYSSTLSRSTGSEDVAAVVRNILVETQEIVSRSKMLESKLQESSQEITNLRENLRVVRHEAETDGLTGIANRKFFDRRLQEEIQYASAQKSSLCLLLTDIDHFKKFNDTYGHRVGDSVLKVVARHLKDSIKGADLAARYGGEEFAVILPETHMEDATNLANQIREKLAKRELKNAKNGENYGKVTLSIGVARFHLGEPIGAFVERADEGLYRAKQLGRNKVVNEDELQGPAVSIAS